METRESAMGNLLQPPKRNQVIRGACGSDHGSTSIPTETGSGPQISRRSLGGVAKIVQDGRSRLEDHGRRLL